MATVERTGGEPARAEGGPQAVERLSLEAAGASTLIAAEHLHRYNLAAELCAGLRVADVCCGTGYGCQVLRSRATAVTGIDNHAPTIDAARDEIGRGEGGEITFEATDALDFLGRELGDRFDALVMFEALEHLEDPEQALTHLERHASNGMRLIVSVPNSKAFDEENPHHVTDYGFEEAMDAFERLGDDVAVLYQFHAEGSLIRPGEPAELHGQVILPEYGEPEYAKHFIACVNFGGALGPEAWARMDLGIAPHHMRYVRHMERANHELWRENARLMRRQIGAAGSGAVALLERERLALEKERIAQDIVGSLSWRITAPLRSAKRLAVRLSARLRRRRERGAR